MIRLVALCISKLTPRVCCHCSQHCFRFRKCLYYKEVVLYESVVSVKAFFNVVLLGLGRQRTEGKRAFSNEPWGMSQPDFTRLSLFCFPLCLSLSHFVLCVLTRCLSWVLLMLLYNLSNLCSSLCPSFFFVILSLPFPFLMLFFVSLLPAVFPLSPAPVAAVWWQKHVTVPCHDQHSSVPVNDTYRHPTMHITMVARLSAGWISGKKSHFGSAPGAVYSRGDISDSGWHCSGRLCHLRSVTIIDFHSDFCERKREGSRGMGNVEDKLVIFGSQSFLERRGWMFEKKRCFIVSLHKRGSHIPFPFFLLLFHSQPKIFICTHFSGFKAAICVEGV